MTEYKIPNHVAIILDGNGRWAKKRNLKRSEGHKEGFENLKLISKYILNKGIKYLSVFAFSTENFKRDKEEVDYLMNLFVKKFKKEAKTFLKENIKIVFSGRRTLLREDVLNSMDYLSNITKDCTKGTLNICLNYGGHAEIIDAIKKVVSDIENNKLDIKLLDEQVFNKYLYHDLPPIDLLIRTSGEERISNFMLWQLSYAELYFPETFFPDFKEKDFDKALEVYTKRDRRFGGIKK